MNTASSGGSRPVPFTDGGDFSLERLARLQHGPIQKRRRSRAIDGFAAVKLVQDKNGPRSFPGESIRLLLAGGRELILPVSMPARLLVELLVALESKPRERSI